MGEEGREKSPSQAQDAVSGEAERAPTATYRSNAVGRSAALERADRGIPIPLQVLFYILALAPLLGWIIGWIYKGKDYYFGRRLIIIATVSFAVGLILSILR